jgi:hypothetical protein
MTQAEMLSILRDITATLNVSSKYLHSTALIPLVSLKHVEVTLHSL